MFFSCGLTTTRHVLNEGVDPICTVGDVTTLTLRTELLNIIDDGRHDTDHMARQKLVVPRSPIDDALRVGAHINAGSRYVTQIADKRWSLRT